MLIFNGKITATKEEAKARLETCYTLIINEHKEHGIEASCKLQDKLWPEMEQLIAIINPKKED